MSSQRWSRWDREGSLVQEEAVFGCRRGRELLEAEEVLPDESVGTVLQLGTVLITGRLKNRSMNLQQLLLLRIIEGRMDRKPNKATLKLKIDTLAKV